jgi:hypothetical protein
MYVVIPDILTEHYFNIFGSPEFFNCVNASLKRTYRKLKIGHPPAECGIKMKESKTTA